MMFILPLTQTYFIIWVNHAWKKANFNSMIYCILCVNEVFFVIFWRRVY